MALIKNEWLVPIGGICLAIALLADRFLVTAVDVPLLDFLVGVLTGLSITLNLVGLVKMGRKVSL
ncbi:MAG: hypothetical protein RTU63_14135 [Candidatus Thorarchaeota archaeon]